MSLNNLQDDTVLKKRERYFFKTVSKNLSYRYEHF